MLLINGIHAYQEAVVFFMKAENQKVLEKKNLYLLTAYF